MILFETSEVHYRSRSPDRIAVREDRGVQLRRNSGDIDDIMRYSQSVSGIREEDIAFVASLTDDAGVHTLPFVVTSYYGEGLGLVVPLPRIEASPARYTTLHLMENFQSIDPRFLTLDFAANMLAAHLRNVIPKSVELDNS